VPTHFPWYLFWAGFLAGIGVFGVKVAENAEISK
jgi:hypothetical protein